MKIVTIWNTYGRYHLARVAALVDEFPEAAIVCFSHCRSNMREYPFFKLQPPVLRVAVDKDEGDLRFAESFLATRQLLEAEKPDLVLTCGYERAETLAAVWYSVFTPSLCFLMLDNQYADRRRHWMVEAVKRLYLRFFDGFIYGGDTHHNYLRRLNVPPNREVFGYNCVDNDAIQSLSDRYRQATNRLGPKDNYFLCVARLIRKKNLVNLLKAYSVYLEVVEKRTSTPWKLVIVGEGPMRKEVETTILELHLSGWVQLEGQVDAFEDVVNYHAFASAVILASDHNEQWGLVINEAMAAGRPVLVSVQCGCASALVREGENGFKFDGHSVQQIAESLVRIHGKENDLDAMGARSREIIATVSPQNFARNVRLLFERGKNRSNGQRQPG